ncbi:claudin-8-like [Pelobates cultripes]|uniref:Claudin n=1 Tax=Pelobates cultripes TaxID=61616 RepID=A0AAD1QYA6_PELCU|nr:claudin-8-like [Pelobates cultripes]
MEECIVQGIVQGIGMILGSIGVVLTVAVCAMPSWKVSIVGEGTGYGNRIGGQWISRWDGLWETCVRQTNSPISCYSNSESLSLTPDLKASRILMSLAVLIVLFAFLNSLIGIFFNKCCRQDRRNQNCLMLIAGISYILAGIFVLIPVTWTAANILRDVCFTTCKSIQQQEIGGSILCWYHACVCRERKDTYTSRSSRPESERCPEEDLLGEELHVYRCSRNSSTTE